MKYFILLTTSILNWALSSAQSLLEVDVSSEEKRKAVVEFEQSNFLYAGIDNPVNFYVKGYSKFTVTILKGTISFSDGRYSIYEKFPCIDTVIFTTLKGVLIYKKLVEVKSIPLPIAMIGGLSEKNVSKNIMIPQLSVNAISENFYFEIYFKVTRFKMYVFGKDIDTYELESNSNLITTEMKNAISLTHKSNHVTIDDIYAIDPTGRELKLKPVTYEIE